jgi:hypothetical protein
MIVSPPAPDSDEPDGESDALNTVIIVIEGPGDTTRRPRRPSIPYTPPEDIPPSPKKRKKDSPQDGPKDDV